MVFFGTFWRTKIQRFKKTLKEEGMRSALAKTRRHLLALIRGYGLTGLFARRVPAKRGADYLTSLWQEVAEQNAFHVTQAPALLSHRRKIAMIGDLNLPQCRKYRVEQLGELWQEKQVEYMYSHFMDTARAVQILQNATHLMLYRLSNTPETTMLLYEARRLRLPILYDIDDPLFSVSAYATYKNMQALPREQKAHFVREAPKYLDVLNAADVVSVSTPGMRAHAQLYSNRPIFLRRNFADLQTLEAGRSALTGTNSGAALDAGFRVGFASGSQGHEVDFAEIQDDLVTFLGADPKRQLVILGHFDTTWLPPKLAAQVETHKFSNYNSYLEVLASLDCAVMPLADDIFNRCKSGVRVIDAAAVGVPAVVGTVGDMAQMVENGRTGRVIEAGASWAAALEEMAANPAETRAMGAAARTALEGTWSASLEPHVIDPELIKWVCA